MCGIAGLAGRDIHPDSLQRALSSLHHRGPDGQGKFEDQEKKVTLGHTRLSIIDLASGRQPLSNEDESIILVCNGEIYDFERLRQELIEQGHRFHTQSDSEVIIHLYEQYGPDFFHHLRGEFAFLLYDRKEGKLLAVRDRFGIKPLFYSHLPDGSIVFASEAKAIFATGLVRPQLDPVILRNMLSFAGAGHPFKDITLLPPAHCLVYSLSSRSCSSFAYWQLDLPTENEDSPLSLENAKAQLLEKLDEAVSLRMRADVPVGVYLSVGIDSSAVAATMAKMSKEKIHAFSISFVDQTQFDESSLAREAAKKYGMEFHELKLTQEDLLRNFEDCLWYSEHPTQNLHGVGKFLLSQLAQKKVKVVLTGEGGDELFLGYPYFQTKVNEEVESFGNSLGKVITKKGKKKEDKLFRKLRQILGFTPLPEMLQFQRRPYQLLLRRLFAPKHRAILRREKAIFALKKLVPVEECAGRSEVIRKQAFSIRNFLANYILIVLGDRQEMAHSLEGRTPLLDHQLFEFSKKIPLNLKICGSEEKFVFKEAVRDRVTESVYKRKKWPYFAPMALVSKGGDTTMDAFVRKYLSRQAIKQAGIFNYPTVRRCMLVTRLLKFSPLWQARFNALLMVILSVQILAFQYTIEFEQNLKKHIS